jgi:hypothetical protein
LDEAMKRTFIRYMRFHSVLLGNVTYKQAQAQEVDDLKTIHDVARMELLIDVYFPLARPILEILPPGRKLQPFGDFLEFSLTHAQLKDLFENEDAHRD